MYLTKKERASFLKMLRMTHEELHWYMYSVLLNYYNKKDITVTSDYIYCRGNIPVCLVAHMDLAGKGLPPLQVLSNERYVTSINSIIGGDDRNGCFIIKKILAQGLKPTIVLTQGEEMGGTGASAFCKDFDKMENIKYFIQLDRKGFNDAVFYNLDNVIFEDYIVQQGFEVQYGSFSDISTLCPHFGIAGVNLSVSFYNEHMSSEYIDIAGMVETFNKVLCMVKEANKEEIPFYEYFDLPYKAWGGYNNAYYDTYGTKEYKDSLVHYQGENITMAEYYKKTCGVFADEEDETVGSKYDEGVDEREEKGDTYEKKISDMTDEEWQEYCLSQGYL